MSEYQPTLTHEANGVDRLLERFKGRPNFEALLRIFLKRVQHFDDVVYELYTGVWLDNATGAQLDNLGDVVGEQRLGRSDTLFRLGVRARILINRSNGKVPELLKLARLLVGDSPDITYTPQPPAAFSLDIIGVTSDPQTVHDLLDQMRGAGIRMDLTYADDIEHAFTFAVDDTPDVLDTDKGFGDDTDPTTGGHLAGVI